MQQQIQEPQEILNEIFNNLKFIQTQSSAAYIQGQLIQQKILLFQGFKHSDADEYYVHFQDQTVMAEDEYIKIVKLVKNKKVAYIINTPYSLEGITNKELCLKQCVTRIILYQVLLQCKDCKFHIVVNFDKLQGKTQQEKLNQMVDYGIFNYGQLMFKNQQVTLILNTQNQQEISYSVVQDIKKCVINLEHILKQQTLRKIFKNDIFYYLQIQKQEDYGPMTLFLQLTMEDYCSQIQTILRNYQDQLLFLQKIPTLQDEYDLNKAIISLLNQLNNKLQKQSNCNLEFTSTLFKVINETNNSYREIINQSLGQMNTKVLGSFLEDQGISLEAIQIPEIVAKVSEVQFINKMLKQYIKKEFEVKNLSEIINLKLNIKCWNSYSFLTVESIIQNFKQITEHIQIGPEEKREVGVFLFGKSRVGKSTLINLLKNPDSLTIEKRISELCYVIKNEYQTEFKIEHGCMSETQNISGMQIGDVWYYDCPGFDDNISQQIRIAHRISLYNYLVKTKNVIGFFLIDSSNRDAQIIKDTIDPIYQLLQDKNQLAKDNNKWASLVLVKTKESTRKDYIENWEEAYHGFLDGKYTFYRDLYQNENQCIEFPKPQKKFTQEQIQQQNRDIQKKFLSIVNEKSQNQGFQLQLHLSMESKLFHLYEIVLSMLQIKIEQIVALLTNQLNNYILEDEDTLVDKKKLIQNLKSFIFYQINQNNVKQILLKILEWCKLNQRFNTNSQFLQRTIDDVLKCLKIDDYCKIRKISPIKVDTSILQSKAIKIIQIIDNIEKIELGLKAGLIILSIGSVVASFGALLVAEGALGTAALEVVAVQVAKKVAIRAAVTGASGAGGSTITFIVFYFKQNLLKSRYESYLIEEEKKANR